MVRTIATLSLFALLAGGSLASSATADDVPAPAPAPGRAPVVSRVEARTFASREDAAKALVEALEKNDDAALQALLGGPDADLVQSGADDAVRRERAALAAEARRKTDFEEQPDGRVLVTVGETDYPLALPLVRAGDRWRVDADAGRKELLARRIGEHEVEAIGTCLAYAEAQEAYASKDRDGDGAREYAQRLRSTPGTHDGLFWVSDAEDDRSPAASDLSPLKDALEAGAAPRAPFNGYYWRVLTAQGPHAPGGAYSYVIHDDMVAGYALLAVPAVHRNTGVKSFLVSRHGKVYEKDLGPDTLRQGAAILSFDPDETWRVVDDATLRLAAGTSPDDAPFLDGHVSPATPTGASVPAAPNTPDVPRDDAPRAPGAPCPGAPRR